jgi:hypothetical protein
MIFEWCNDAAQHAFHCCNRLPLAAMRERGIGSVRPPSRGQKAAKRGQSLLLTLRQPANGGKRTRLWPSAWYARPWQRARWREIDLATQPKGHHAKVNIAQQLRTQTPMSSQWIAGRLRMGSTSLRERVYVNRAPTARPSASDCEIDGLRRRGIPGQERLPLDKQGGKTI